MSEQGAQCVETPSGRLKKDGKPLGPHIARVVDDLRIFSRSLHREERRKDLLSISFLLCRGSFCRIVSSVIVCLMNIGVNYLAERDNDQR